MTDWETRYYEAEAQHTEANGMLTAERDAMAKRYIAANLEATELRAYAVAQREALQKYGTHLYGCMVEPCGCGLDAALAKNPNPAGVGNAAAVTDGEQHAHEPGSRDFTAHTARNVDSCAGKTADRESGASHPVGEGYGHETRQYEARCARVLARVRTDINACGEVQSDTMDAIDELLPTAGTLHQSCTQPCPDCGRRPPGPQCGNVVQRITNVDGLRIDTETLPACLQRTDADYAMQHAGYLATAATEFMDACNAFEEAREKHEDAEPGAEAAAAYDVMFAAQEAHSEAWSGLRTAVYEFEKRRDRALRHQVGRESPGVEAIAAERARQISAEGWTPEHDDEHDAGALAFAAVCYAFKAGEQARGEDAGLRVPLIYWPWDASWWKPRDPRRNLVRAGALIAAEIDRLDRAEKLRTVACTKLADRG